MDWHGYFVVERLNIGISNWNVLIALFEVMGTEGSPMPAFNTHWCTRLDGDAVIYESMFDTSEISVEAFKQMLADEFGVPIEEIDDVETHESYAGGTTAAYIFLYNTIERFKVERFGGGGATWLQSGNECRGYLSLYRDEWEPTD